MEEQAIGGQQILDSVGRLREITVSVQKGSQTMATSGDDLIRETDAFIKLSNEAIKGMNDIVNGALKEIKSAVTHVTQMTEENNQHLYGHSPLMDLVRDGDEPRIREFARAAADWGHPFLFRLNNEMNTDWVSYGGVNNLIDPDLFIEIWRIIYRIFEEEGVNNAIWIWNPNDRDAPPNSWNSFTAYYPGNNYVHMFGVTGYNTGTHYADLHGESWREFQQIYDHVVQVYDGLFDDFPWIITEFASSSVGGDKVAWIDRMFSALPRYRNIRAAVWFSYVDWDFRFPYGEVPARPYWLDETPETLEAFRRGVNAWLDG